MKNLNLLFCVFCLSLFSSSMFAQVKTSLAKCNLDITPKSSLSKSGRLKITAIPCTKLKNCETLWRFEAEYTVPNLKTYDCIVANLKIQFFDGRATNGTAYQKENITFEKIRFENGVAKMSVERIYKCEQQVCWSGDGNITETTTNCLPKTINRSVPDKSDGCSGMGRNGNIDENQKYETTQPALEAPIETDTIHLDTNDNHTTEGYKIYPNPAKEFLIIENTDFINNATIHIFDVNGRIMKTLISVSEVSQIEINDLPQGVYIIQSATFTAKFVKIN